VIGLSIDQSLLFTVNRFNGFSEFYPIGTLVAKAPRAECFWSNPEKTIENDRLINYICGRN